MVPVYQFQPLKGMMSTPRPPPIIFILHSPPLLLFTNWPAWPISSHKTMVSYLWMTRPAGQFCQIALLLPLKKLYVSEQNNNVQC